LPRVFTTFLSRAGHQVLNAADGLQAQAILGAERVDVLITDLHMPGLDGLALALSSDPHAVEDGSRVSATAASLELLQAAARRTPFISSGFALHATRRSTCPPNRRSYSVSAATTSEKSPAACFGSAASHVRPASCRRVVSSFSRPLLMRPIDPCSPE